MSNEEYLKLKYFNQKEIEEALDYPSLIIKLEDAFRNTYAVPPRLHYDYESGSGNDTSTLLLMPAWKNEQYIGLKILTLSPYNSEQGLATIQGIYILMDAKDGQVIAQFDAKSITNLRTAASSALASKYLSRENASTLFVLGTGALSSELIKAHCAMRPIKNVMVWGRNYEKSQQIAHALSIEDVEIKAVNDIQGHIHKADIISTATSSPDPLIFGDQMIPGQHLDLVGAFKPTWREADDAAIINSTVYVDTRQGTLKESGELLIPMGKELFDESKIKADLFELCKKETSGRSSEEEITSFISVGYALEDLAAAELVWEKYVSSEK